MALAAVAADDTRPETVRIAFRAFAVDPVDGLYYRPRPDAALQPIRFFSSELTASYPYEGPPQLTLWRKATDEETAAGVVELDPEQRHVLLLLRPSQGAAGANGWEVLRWPAVSRVPAGSVGCWNATNQSYELEQGGRQWLLRSGVGPTLRLTDGVLIRLFWRRGEERRPVGALELPPMEDARAWLILFPPYREGERQPQVRVVYEGITGLGRADFGGRNE